MHKILLIIQREYLSRVKKKSFLLTTFLLPLLFMGMYAIVFYMALNNKTPQTSIYVVDRSGIISPKLENTSSITYHLIDNADIDVEKRSLQERDENSSLLVIPKDIIDQAEGRIVQYGEAKRFCHHLGRKQVEQCHTRSAAHAIGHRCNYLEQY